MTDRSLREFVAALAAKTPTPGGGAAAANGAAIGAGLLAMVFRYARARRVNEELADDLDTLVARIDAAVVAILPMAELDAEDYRAVAEAFALPKDDPDRTAAIQAAMRDAMRVPESLHAVVADLLEDAARHRATVAKAMLADLVTAAELLRAGARGAAQMFAANAEGIGADSDLSERRAAFAVVDARIDRAHACLVEHTREHSA